MESKLIDSHTHVQFATFKKDYDQVIQRALDAGIWMVNVGTQKDTSRRAIEIANKYSEGVYATVGIHPIHTDKSFYDADELDGDIGFTSRSEEFNYEYYKKLAQNSKVVAIGECGLDYYRSQGNKKLNIKNKKLQEKAFISQIKLAHEIKKPLMIHCRAHPKPRLGRAEEGREAYDDLIKILNSYFIISNSNSSGIIHFFTGTQDQAQKLLDMGFYFSFGGVITFTHDYDEVIKFIPLNRILLETDAPYVSPAPYRGKRNEPLYVIKVAQRLFELKGVEFSDVSNQTTQNTRTVFNL